LEYLNYTVSYLDGKLILKSHFRELILNSNMEMITSHVSCKDIVAFILREWEGQIQSFYTDINSKADLRM